METPYFSVVLRGYDRREVDAAVSRIRRSITEGAPPHPASLRELEFSVTFRGYDREEVDAYIDLVIRKLSGMRDNPPAPDISDGG